MITMYIAGDAREVQLQQAAMERLVENRLRLCACSRRNAGSGGLAFDSVVDMPPRSQ